MMAVEMLKLMKTNVYRTGSVHTALYSLLNVASYL